MMSNLMIFLNVRGRRRPREASVAPRPLSGRLVRGRYPRSRATRRGMARSIYSVTNTAKPKV